MAAAKVEKYSIGESIVMMCSACDVEQTHMRYVQHVQPRRKNLGGNGQIENGVAVRQDPQVPQGPGDDAYAFRTGRGNGGHRISEDRRSVRRPDAQIDPRSGIISA